MSQLCRRTQCVAEIEDIVMGAKERIVLVSPYIKADENIVERLKRRTNDVKVVVIYGKDKNQPQAKSLLEVSDVTKIFVKNLHAKCYLNEDKALVTSMNLYEYSQINNEEMGILVTRENDKQLYEEVIREVHHWEEIGDKQSPTANKKPKPRSKEPSKASVKATKSERRYNKNRLPTMGFCIRCAEGVDIDPTDLKPYCLDCYKKWKKSKQTVEHREQYCHVCGKDHKASLKRPCCLLCHKKYKDVIDFKSVVTKTA